MSADLPEPRIPGGPLAMAKLLVTYLDDPLAIRSAIKGEYEHSPDLRTIKDLRARHLKSLVRPQEIHMPCDAHRPNEASESAAWASTQFLAALDRERALSAVRAAQQGALDSPALRQPAIVDTAWERETEVAWRQNSELP